MATAREESNPYDGGLGAGGKFRKRPFRRSTQPTPYDRPPTAIRNPTAGGDRNGWLSKLVDPAQRLLTSSAHRLFASVFRKRLPPPPPPQPPAPEPESHQESRENPPEATSTDPPVLDGGVTGRDNSINHTDGGGVAELEEILKQKTFTRSEIDRLTTLLRSRTVDIPGGSEEKRSEVRPVVLHDRKEEFPNTPVREHRTGNHLISTPIVSSTVLDEDVASPAELAKAYMGSRPSKVSVSTLGLHNQVPRGDAALLSNTNFPSKSPTMSLVPRSSGHVGSLGNGFVTSRSRGRSAIYSMARTPYSRVNSVATLKGAGTAGDALGGPSTSSQSAWKQNRMSLSGSRQGALKRGSSFLDNDIGSVGPIRRIRQKSNLLSSKNLSLPASGGPISAYEAGTSSAGVDTQHHVSLRETPALLGEARHSFSDVLAENGDNSTPGTSFTPVPSKSSQTASKILQQLDKMVSPREKSPTKLSPSMLHGQALKSLENVDSSKFLENMHDGGKFGGSHSALPDVRDSTSHKRDKVEENGSTKLVAFPDKSGPALNGVDTDSLMKDNVPSVKTADSTEIKSVVQLPQQKRRAFKMSAHEDYLDLDDDDHTNGAVSATFEGRENLDNCVVGSKRAAAEAITVEKPSSLSEVKPISSSVLNQKPDLGTSDGSVVEKNAGITFPVAQVTTSSVQATLSDTQRTLTANKDAASKESNAVTPMLSFGEKVVPAKQPDAAAPTFGFTSTNVGDVSSVSGSSGVKFATSADQKQENSISFTSAPVTNNSLLDKSDKENTLNGVFLRTAETANTSALSTSTSAGSIFKFGASANSATLNNGSLASSPFSFSSTAPPLVSSNGQSSSSRSTNYTSFTTNSDTSAAATVSTTANATISSTSSPSTQASVPSLTAAPVFKFASSADPSTSASTLSATSGEATEAKAQGTSFGNVAVAPFGSTSAFTSSGSIFGGTPEVACTLSSTSGGTTAAVSSSLSSSFNGTSSTSSGSDFFSSTFPTATSTGNGIFGDTTATKGTGSSVFGGTSLPKASTGSSIFSTSSAITSTGGSIFGFSAPAASTGTAQTQGSNSFNAVNTQASAAGTGVAASTQSMPIQFVSSASSPSFGLAGNTTFSSGSSVFGSSASEAKPFGSGATFGMSSSSSESNSLSSSSGIAAGTFGSNWQAPKTPIFGSTFSTSSSPGFSFGSSSVTAPSSAPSIFGSSTGASSSSMFSFTSAATPSQPVFGNTSPGMVFGSGNNDQMEDSMAEDTVQASSSTITTFGQQPISPPPASGFIFGASNPSGANSFQFGSQANLAGSQNPSPFQASGSVEFGGGGSFSLGTGGSDKSGRKFVKVRKGRKK